MAMNIATQAKRPKIPVFNILGSQFGPAGRLLGGLIDVFRVGDRVSEEDVRRGVQVMEDVGLPLTPSGIRVVDLREWASQQGVDPDSQFLVDTVPDYRLKMLSPASPEELPPTKGDLPGPRSRKAIPDIDIDNTRDSGMAVRRVRQVGKSGAPRDSGRTALALPRSTRQARTRKMQTADPLFNDYTLGGLMPTGPSEPDVFANEQFFYKSSSNVYSMAYDELRGILYVTYKAPGSIGRVGDINSCNGESYTYAIRPEERGPMYSYGGPGNPVPKSVWEEAKATASAGKFVWDKLRVCGSFTGHQYKYSLVSPSMSGSLYIPRKAVIYRDPETNEGRLGFRVRAVPTVGRGKRPYLTSDGDYVT
jgi:hypothetical protein